MSDIANRPLKPIEKYQKRITQGTVKAAFDNDLDVLVQAPTGGGKSAMMADTSRLAVERGKRVLILTHRKTLFRQLAGNPKRETQKEKEGEISWWSNLTPGTIADRALGGINQEPDVVVGMVETVSNNLSILDQYDLVQIDEAHHASNESDERQEKGSYAAIIDYLSDAKIVGYTANIFRGDGGKLHPRLENAHREVVSVEEAQAAGRIVKARTIIGKAPLDLTEAEEAAGKMPLTSADLMRQQLEGRLGSASASAMAKKMRGDAFYQHCVDDWDRLLDRRKTIVFVDSIKEVDAVRARFDATYGEGTAVAIHGNKSFKDNEADIERYATGGADVLISCEMIGEGFDVPATDCVMSMNSSLSRPEMNQYAGRTLRASEGKVEGLFVDYGTASVKYGPIEVHHEFQDIDALSAMGTRAAGAIAIGRMAPVADGDWSVMTGEHKTLFMKNTPKGYLLYDVNHHAEKDMNRRTRDPLHGFGRVTNDDNQQVLMDAVALSKVMTDHARKEAAHYARQGGFKSKSYHDECKSVLTHYKGVFSAYDKETSTSPDELLRRKIVKDDVRAVTRPGINSRLVMKAVLAAKTPKEMVREGLALSGAALEVCAESPNMPLGLRSESRAMGSEFSDEKLKTASAKELYENAKATRAFFVKVHQECPDENIKRVLQTIDAPMKLGMTNMKTLARAASAAR